MKVLGIDLGSREVKIAVFNNKKLIKKMGISTMTFYRDYCKFDGKLNVDMDKLGITKVDKFVSTGYGKNNTDFEKFEKINEVKAHVYGSLFQTGLKDFVLLDIGGQDIKVAKVEKGTITDLELNDKCAASCGRYLENMANILEVPVKEIFKHYEEPIELNSTCAVFSESELIGKIAEGADISKLCAGVNLSLYKRIKPLLGRFKSGQLVLSGGVAFNVALIKYLANDYENIIIPPYPQHNGAIGCCYYAGINS